MEKLQQYAITLCFACAGILLIQAVFPPSWGTPTPAVDSNTACKGEAIVVDYPFEGGYLEPHACKVQCTDQVDHYVLYTNGKATQCDTLPGCNDYGEDRGVTCVPPTK